MLKLYTFFKNSTQSLKADIVYPISIFSVACMVIMLSSFSTKSSLNNELNSITGTIKENSTIDASEDLFSSCCTRTVSHTDGCATGGHYVIWMNNSNKTSSTAEFYIPTGGSASWEECDDGTVHFTATGLVSDDSPGETLNVNITYSGKTHSPPSGSPKANDCGSYGVSDWVYYTSLSGTITSNTRGNFGVHATGPAFQVGTKANVRASSGFGASGWYTLSGGNYWTNGDVNVQLSASCEMDCNPPSLNCSGSDYSWSGMDRFIDNGTTSRCYNLSGFENALEVDISEIITFDCYGGRSNVTNQKHERLKVIFKNASGDVVGSSSYTPDLEDGVNSATYQGSLGTVTLSPAGATQVCVIHYEDPNNGAGSQTSANSLYLTGLCLKITNSCNASNFDPGTYINGNQSNCGAFDAGPITATEPTGCHGGHLEYRWYRKGPDTGGSWELINSATKPSYDPPFRNQSYWYRREVKCAPCGDWVITPGSNGNPFVDVHISKNYTNGGTIGNDQEFCGSGDPAKINSTTDPIGEISTWDGFLNTKWQSMTLTGSWEDIPGFVDEGYDTPAVSWMYDPGTINETTKYRRGVRVLPCTEWIYSNVVTITVTPACNITTHASDEEVECNGNGNTQQYNDWINSNGGAHASSSDCNWTHEVISTNYTCGNSSNDNGPKEVTVRFILHSCDGNKTTEAKFIVEDNTAPDITAAPDRTVECLEDVVAEEPTFTQECAHISVSTTGPTLVSGDEGCDGAVYKFDYKVEDGCKNVANATQHFTLNSDAPTIHCAADVTVSCLSDVVVDLNSVNTSTSCGTNGNVTADGPHAVAGNSDCGELDGDQYTITYTITDACGRTDHCTQTFTIDSEEPTIHCAADVTVSCLSDVVVDLNSVNTSTSCGTNGNVTADGPHAVAGNSDCGELDGDHYTITYTITDACGRTDHCTQTFTIDSEEPTIHCAADVTVSCLSDVVVDLNSVTTSTSCGTNGNVTADGPHAVAGNSDCGELDGDQYTITYTITDACGRTDHCTQTFTIDSEEPTIHCAADVTVSCLSDVVVDLTSVTTSTSCGTNGNVTADGPHAVAGNSDCGELDGDQYTITYTITDACGRTDHCTQTFTIDSAEPTIHCAADVTVSCLSDVVVDLTSVTTSTSCGTNGNVTADGPHAVAGNSDCGELDGDQYTITYTITDACGRTDHCTQTFTIDSAEPTIHCAADVTVSCLSDVVVDLNSVNTSTSCGTNGNVTADGPNAVAGNSDCGELDGDQYTITYTITDACGRTDHCTQTFTIDSAEPTISCAGDETVSCLSDIVADVNSVTTSASCGDNGNVTAGPITPGANNSDCGELDGDTYTITYTITDACGRTDHCTQTFTIDSAEPTISCAGDETVSCLSDIVADVNSVTTSASCGDNGNVTAGPITPGANNSDCGELDGDTYTITYTITDACGRTDHCTQTFTIDSAEPTISCAGDETVSCLSDIVADVNSVTTSASCGDNGNVTAGPITPGANNSDCGELDGDTYTITYTITDACGRTDHCTQTFTIDSAEPTISCAGDETVSCLSDIVADVNSVTTSASCGDNGNVTAGLITPGANNSDCGELDGDSYTITYTITDACGRTDHCTQTFTIDSAEPTISCAADVTVECLSDVVVDLTSVTTSTSCGTNGNVTADGPNAVAGNSDCGELDGDQYTITYTITDACGRTDHCTQTFTIDSAEPTISCAADVTVECLSDVVVDLTSVTTSTSCGTNGNVTADGPNAVAGNSDCGELDGDQYTITYTITDACGRTDHCTQTFTIDSEEPAITCPADETVECLSDVVANIAGTTTSVSCSGNGSVTASDPVAGANNSDCGELDGDTYTITYTVTDNCGRTAECTQVFTIDSEEPAITCPADETVECLSDVVANIAGTTTSVSCSGNGSVTASDPVAGANNSDCGELDGDTYTITYTVTDNCGRTAECTQVFTIDSEEPAITCPADETVECLSDVVANIAGTTTSVSCSGNGSVTASDPVAGANNSDCGELDGDTYTITYTVTDNCGRTAECTQVFTIDSEEPAITCPADETVECLSDVVANIAGTTTSVSCSGNGSVTASDPVAGANNSDCGELDGDTYTITYTVTDNCGRTAECTQVFTIDSEEPAITCPADETVECLSDVVANIAGTTTSVSCSGNGSVTASDPVAGANNSDCGELDGDTYTITYTVTDNCGRTAECTQVFTIDSEEPAITCPADETVECLSDVVANIAGTTTSVSCSGNGSVTASDPVAGANNSDCGELDGDTYTITYTVTDNCGRTAECTQVFTIDSEEPAITCPADETVECLSDVVANIAGTTTSVSCSGNGSVTASDPVAGANNSDCGELDGDTYTITYTVTDNCGRTAECTQVFTIDSEEPAITCPADETVECLSDVVANIAGTTTSVSCSGNGSVTASDPVAGANNSDCGELDGDTYTITYTVTDNCGRTAECTQVFTIDSEEPAITCPADETVECLSDVVANIAGTTTSVSCSGNGSVTASDPVAGANNSDCGELDGDTYTITYTVTDNCGRTAECTQVFTIDSEEPAITCPADETVECLSDVVANIAGTTTSVSCSGNGSVTASDPVAGANNSDCGELDGDTYTITYTVTDNCGRTAECTQVFTIDSEEPAITCPADETVECLSDVVANIAGTTTSVSCSGNGSVTASDPVAGANNSDCGELDGDTYTITYTVTDNCGRTAECTQVFTIDSEEPAITCPADETVECLSDVVANIAGTTTSVSCSGNGSVTASDPVAGANNSDCGELDGDTYTITYTVTDNCGRTAECTQVFTIDSEEPAITCPADETVECLSDVVANIAGTTTSVSCSGNGSVTASDPVAGANNSDCGELDGDTYTITYTVTDNCGRTAECTQVFTIDSEEPAITCPADETVECLSDVVANIAGTTTSVSCSGNGSVTASDPVAGANNSDCGELDGDTYTITYTVTDNCGRTAECTQVFTIDSEEPAITCPADETVECLSDVVANIAGTTTSVSCSGNGSVTASDPVAGANNSDCGELDGDTYTITYTVTDNCGRTAECTQVFTIDSEEPAITCPADETVECLSDVVANIAGTTTSVSCSGNGSVTASDPVAGANNSDCGELDGDTYTITYTVTDNCGRTAECTQVFTIDSEEPAITCPADETVECLSDVVANIAGTTTSVSCSGNGSVTASDPVAGANNSDCGELDGDTYTITYTVTDNCGRTAECTQVFTIDSEEPAITCPADETVECLSDVVANIAGTTTSVSCSGNGSVTASDPVAGANNSDCGELDGDTYTITYTVTDNCGRTAECTQVFTIDSEEPAITCPADETVECLSDVVANIAGTTTSVSCSGNGSVTASDPVAGANNSDCGELDGDTYTITYTVTDNCGRTAECTQVFTIDSEEPAITCPADETVECLSDVVANIAGTTTSVSCSGNGSVTASDPVAGANNSDCGELDGDTYTITYTVTDNCGRTAECTQVFTIDSEEPAITCPADETVECLSDVVANIAGTTTSVSCSGNGSVTASDPVAGANNSDCGELTGDTYTITYTVTDNCGRSAECTQVFTIQSAAPTIHCPADETVECLSDVVANIAGTTTSVSCSGNGSVTASDPVAGANNSDCGELDGDTYTITYTVTDNCGRTAECTQVFTIDSEEPAITCPADETVECLSDVVANIAGTTTSVSCSGNGSVTASDPVAGANNSDCGELTGDTYTITYTVTDNCGRSAECTQVFTIQSAAPTIHCPADETVECLSDVVANIAGTTTSVSCSGNGSVTASDPVAGANNSDCGELTGDTYTITYTVTDNCGRSAECTQVFTIQSAAPTIHCPADETVECLSDVVANIAGTTTSVSCSGNGSVEASDPVAGANNSDCGELTGDTYTITYTVTDNCGRSAECTQVFTIQSAAPTIHCPADETVECLSDVVANIAGTTTSVSCSGNGNVEASDPVAGANNSDCGELTGDTYTITYTVTDNCGRSAECTQVFTIQSAAPTIHCPADETVECLSDVVANIAGTTTSVSCSGNGNVEASDPVAGANNSDCGELTGDTYTITYTVTDNCGRSAECTQVFTIQSAAPTIHCPADETVECLSDVVANIAGTTTSVSCSGNGNVEASDPVAGANNSDCGELTGDTYTITYTVTDNCGRSAECTQVFTIQSAAPTIHCPADETVECLSDVVANIAGTTTSVSCSGNGNVEASDPVAGANNSDCGELTGDTYTITYTVTDNCGRSAECTQVFTIQSAAPTIHCPADETVECLSDVVANIAGTTTSVSCSGNGNVEASDPVAGANNSDCGELTGDTYTITYTVTDNCGRSAECTQVFTIQSAAPTIHCPADETVECLSDVVANIAGTTTSVSCSGNGNVEASDPVAGANNSDCGELTGDTYTITYTVTDNCGRSAECTQVFTIQSSEPTISCPADETVECIDLVVPVIDDVITSVSCGGSVSNVVASDPVPGAGNSACGETTGDTYTITYTVTDACGRSASCDQVYTISGWPPEITCPADETVHCYDDIVAGTPNFGTSCGISSDLITDGPNLISGDDKCDGAVYELIYTITDDCGRSASCTQTFTLDVPATDIDVPATETVECLGDIVASDPTVTTGCGIGYTAEVSDPILTGGSAGCDGATYEVTYTVTDDCGGITTAVTEFTIDNSGAISIDCEPDDITLECSGGNTNQQAADAWNQDNIDKLLACSSTNCTGDLFVTSDYDFNNFTTSCGGGSITVKYTITGSCGEVVEETAFLTIEDTMAPTVTANDITVDLDPNTGTVTITPEMVLGSSDDNCNDPTLTVEPNTFTQDDCGENVVTLVATDACGNTGTATATVTIECLYDLSLTKQVSDASPQIGQSVTYTIQVSNSLGLTATGVSVQDQLPNGLSNPTGISNSGSVSGSNINWSNLTVPGNGSISLSFSATVVAGTDYVNLAEITGADQPDIDSNPGNGADTNGNGIVGSEDPDGSQDPADEDDGDDAVIEPTGKISGTVKSDDDNNGTGDSGISGVTIVLKDTNGNTVATTTTDGSGFYEFDDVPAGNYIIMEMDPAGYEDVSDSDDTTGPNDPDGGNDPQDDQIPVTLAPGEFDDGNNFVELKLGTISGTVTKDTDGNGSGDEGISGVTIVLKDGAGNTVATTTTDGSGYYEFTDLEPGNYTLMEMQPAGLIDVSDEDSTPDPDGADGVVDNSIPVVLGVGEDDANNDFVEAEEGSISGTVKEDTNGDGIGDVGIGGVTILLKDTNGNTIATTTTDSNGNYEFTGIAPGDYILMEMDPAGYDDVSDEDSTPDPDGGNDPVDDQIPVTVSPGENDADNDFVEERLGTISGNVKEDTNGDGTGDDPISGVQIVLKDGSGNTVATTTTDNNGNYEFLGVAPGEYVVMEMQPDGFEDVSDEDATPDPDGADGIVNNSIPVTLAPGEDDADNNFVEEQDASISGYVLEDRDNNDSGDEPISGVQIVLKDAAGNTVATTNTDDNGFYQFEDLSPGVYTLMEMQPDRFLDVSDEDATPDPDGADGLVNNSIPVNLTGGENDADNNFIEEGFVSVGSTVFRDDNNNGVQDSSESGISGVTVQLLDMNGSVVATTTTDGSGNYFFGDLAPGMYFVSIPNPDNTYNTSSTGNASDNGVDGDDNGIQGAPGEATTSPKITLLPNGETTNEPFSGGNQDNAEDFNGDMTIDFGFYGPGSIGDFVWFDIDGDGNQDGGEPGLQGVTVNLLDGSGNFIASTTTGNNGEYLFSGLTPGDYIIEFVTPADYTEVVSSGTDPSNGSTNSDYNPSTGRTSVVGLGSGENITGVDGGFNLILEVSLISFTAEYEGEREIVDLNWVTSNEVNSDYYVVERAYENGAFESIGRVDAAGTSTSELSYNLEDEGIDASGTYLYRLQMVDTDGSFSYSDIISITVRRLEVSEPSVNIFPNPAYDEVNVDIIKNEEDRIEVSLFDLTGRAIGISNVDVQSRGNQASIKVPVKDLARGSYILRINVGDHVFTKKVLFVR